MNEPEGLISLQEGARRLGINDGTLRKIIKRGELRAFRVRSNIIRIDPIELRRFLNSHDIANEKPSDGAKADPQRRAALSIARK
jgi:excisionase family DNA binding protein